MKKTLLFSTLLSGLVLTGCNKATHTNTAATEPAATTPSTEPTVGQRVDAATARTEAAARDLGNDMSRAADHAKTAMANAAHDVAARVNEWRLSSRDIEADIVAHRDIVRTKDSAGTVPTGNIDKSTLKSAVEGRIKADSELANLKLDVNAKRDGEIELEGKAMTADQVGRAIALALDTDGVNKVTSKVKLDKDAVKH
jgi:hypothetical protein